MSFVRSRNRNREIKLKNAIKKNRITIRSPQQHEQQ